MFLSETIEVNNHTKSPSLRPIVFKLNQTDSLERFVTFLSDNQYEIGEKSLDFYEIFAYKDDCELTFSFVSDGINKTILHIVLYTNKHKFSKKKRLLFLINQIKAELKTYLE